MNQFQRAAMFEATELAQALADGFTCKQAEHEGTGWYDHEDIYECWHCWGVQLAKKLRAAQRARK